jgi:hypothetical protein
MRAPAVVLALVLIVGPRAEACPNCTISVDLPPSIASATNIYLGRVVRSLDQRQVEVRVERVLRGPLTQGQRVKVAVRRAGIPVINAKEDLGRLLLLSDPTSAEGEWTYPVLAPEFEDEVRFLMQKKPRKLTSAAQAIGVAQGISDEASNAGLDYLRRHREVTEPLIKAVEHLTSVLVSNRGRYWDWIRLQHLVRALVGNVGPASPAFAKVRAYLLSEVQRFLDHTWRPLDVKAILEPAVPTVRDLSPHCVRGQILGLALAIAAPSLRGEIRRRVESAYPKLAGEGIACAVWTLVSTAVSKPASLGPLKQAEQNDAIAAGLYDAAGTIGEAPARAALRRAASLTKKAALLKAIADRLDRAP